MLPTITKGELTFRSGRTRPTCAQSSDSETLLRIRSLAACTIGMRESSIRKRHPLNNAPDYDVAACITRLNCLDGSVVVGVSVMPPISRLGLAQLPSWRGRNANAPALDVCNGVTSSSLYVP